MKIVISGVRYTGLLQIFYYLFSIILCCLAQSAFATEQQTRLWAGIDLSGDLFASKNWEYDINSQARYIFTGSQYQLTRSEAGLGYKIVNNFHLWFGYTWLIQNANVTQQHRVWEQASWNIIKNDQVVFFSRTRVEERKEVNKMEWAVRLRQRLQLSFPKKIFHTLTPIIYDELFVNVTNPPWVNNQLVDQNRVFIGIDVPILKKADIQVGYINQFQIREPENRDNHIIYANLNIKT